MFQHLPTILICVCVLSTDLTEARRSSSGGGSFSGRGSSGARSNVASGGGGFNNGRGGGFQTHNSGGFHPNNNNNNVRPPAGGFSNTNRNNYPNQNFQPHVNPGFHQGTGLGSTSSRNTFTKALVGGALGAAGGILAYEAGKAIIKSATEPFNYNGRNYNWDNHGHVANGEFQCSIPMSQLIPQTPSTTTTTTTGAPDATTDASATTTTTVAPASVLQNIQYPDGTRPKTIVWTCKVGRESCCGTDCCPLPPQQQTTNGPSTSGMSTLGTTALIIFVVILLLCCGGCLCVFFCCKSAFESCVGDSKQHDGYDEGYHQDQYQMQNYPPQQNQYYQQPPPANYQQQPHGYPQTGNYYPPNQYPAQPTY
ncbi:unnamed protein product [Caenorhabditis bovis]|uniref:CX domain-containing protein n=1 Tax=Caenorhabditis bovis TaxID=2654633 RepID=A0A8S1EUM2_9PELO|nr:unnamed protein product [Caenorhabditis bovis]